MRCLAIFVALGALGCSSPASPDGGPRDSGLHDGGGTDGGSLDGGPDAGSDGGIDGGSGPILGGSLRLDPGLRRLSNLQYANTVRDLLGQSIIVPTDLEPDARIYGLVAIWGGIVSVSRFAAEQYERAAYSVAHQALSDPTLRAALVGCSPEDSGEEVCVRRFLARFMRRAWRRPVSDDELDRYASIALASSFQLRDFWGGLEYAVAGVLQSPHFLFKVETGAPGPSSTCDGLTDHALATRLSYFLWNTTPDDVLLDAADRGELATDEGLRAQTSRLLEDPRAHAALRNFVDELIGLQRLEEHRGNPRIHPHLTSPTILRGMREETLLLFEDLVFTRDADYREVFDTRRTFVDEELARVYGVPPPEGPGFGPITLPEEGPRRGLLGHASLAVLFSANVDDTSPTHRGLFVRTALLCDVIPPPPLGVTTLLPEPIGTQTRRQQLEEHSSNPLCASCHSRMDPIGFALEVFDSGGLSRTTENGLPIDTTGMLDGVPFSGPVELASAVRNHPSVGPCLTRNLFRYATSRVDEPEAERLTLASLSEAFEVGGYRVRALIQDLVLSDAFRCGPVVEEE